MTPPNLADPPALPSFGREVPPGQPEQVLVIGDDQLLGKDVATGLGHPDDRGRDFFAAPAPVGEAEDHNIDDAVRAVDLPLDEGALARIDTIIAGAGTVVVPSPEGI